MLMNVFSFFEVSEYKYMTPLTAAPKFSQTNFEKDLHNTNYKYSYYYYLFNSILEDND